MSNDYLLLIECGQDHHHEHRLRWLTRFCTLDWLPLDLDELRPHPLSVEKRSYFHYLRRAMRFRGLGPPPPRKHQSRFDKERQRRNLERMSASCPTRNGTGVGDGPEMILSQGHLEFGGGGQFQGLRESWGINGGEGSFRLIGWWGRGAFLTNTVIFVVVFFRAARAGGQSRFDKERQRRNHSGSRLRLRHASRRCYSSAACSST